MSGVFGVTGFFQRRFTGLKNWVGRIKEAVLPPMPKPHYTLEKYRYATMIVQFVTVALLNSDTVVL